MEQTQPPAWRDAPDAVVIEENYNGNDSSKGFAGQAIYFRELELPLLSHISIQFCM